MVKTDLITVQIIKTQLMQTYLNMQYSLKSQSLIVKTFISYKAYYMGCIGSFHCSGGFLLLDKVES